MKTTIYMLILLIYEICLIVVRRNYYRDDITDALIRIIPVVMCIIGALG